MKCYSCWHNSTRFHRIFWQNHFCLMIFKSGFWAEQSFNMVIPSSCELWHGALSCWKFLPFSKSCIKLSFSNWMYLVLLKLPSILTNFLESSLFIHLQSIRHLPLNLTVFIVWCGMFCFSGILQTNSYLLECSSILVSLLNMILFQASAFYSSYLFDQFNIVFESFFGYCWFLSVQVLKGYAKWYLLTPNWTNCNHSSLVLQSSKVLRISFHTILWCSFWV